MDFGEKISNFLETTGVQLIQAFVIIVFGVILVKVIMKALKKTNANTKTDKTLSSFLFSLIQTVLYILVFYFAFKTLGFSTTGFIAALSAVGLAIALSLQNSLASLANGIIIISTRPFIAGDYVEINGNMGIVQSVKLFSTKLLTYDNIVIIVPNSQITTNKITNYTVNSTRRVDTVISVAYGSDTEKVKNTIRDVIDANQQILKLPEPFIHLTQMGESSINFTVRVWTSTVNYWDIVTYMVEATYEALTKNNIEIPFNQYDVNLKSLNGLPLEKITQGKKTSIEQNKKVATTKREKNPTTKSLKVGATKIDKVGAIKSEKKPTIKNEKVATEKSKKTLKVPSKNNSITKSEKVAKIQKGVKKNGNKN